MKIAKVSIDRHDRVHFLAPHEVPTEDGWWDSVLRDRRARSERPPINDTMLGNYRAMYVEIFCGNCNRHFAKSVDELLVMYGERCTVAAAVTVQANCQRQAKRCDVQFKIRQWEDVRKLTRQ